MMSQACFPFFIIGKTEFQFHVIRISFNYKLLHMENASIKISNRWGISSFE